jgi:hypothetical protein
LLRNLTSVSRNNWLSATKNTHSLVFGILPLKRKSRLRPAMLANEQWSGYCQNLQMPYRICFQNPGHAED